MRMMQRHRMCLIDKRKHKRQIEEKGMCAHVCGHGFVLGLREGRHGFSRRGTKRIERGKYDILGRGVR